MYSKLRLSGSKQTVPQTNALFSVYMLQEKKIRKCALTGAAHQAAYINILYTKQFETREMSF